MRRYTKHCPFCGEEIDINATRCEYCCEFLNNSSRGIYSYNNSEFRNIYVNWKWKRRFELIDKRVLYGNINQIREEYKNKPFSKGIEILCGIYFSDFLSTLSVLLSGLFWYMFKGMWLKAIVYFLYFVLFYLFVNAVWQFLFQEEIPLVFLQIIIPLILVVHAPYDYYRYKVLGKQF